MCKNSETTQQQETEQKVKLPGWLNRAAKTVTNRAIDFGGQEYQPYTGQRVADFAPDQQTAFQNIRNYAADPGLQVMDFAGQGPQELADHGRVVDDSGPLGAISDYMNPHIDQVLEPAIRRIQEQADQQRKGINARATAAGAFGDARHGITESQLHQDTSRAVGDTAGQILNQAFNQAMGHRSQDLARFDQRDQLGAQFGEQALQRGMQGANQQQANTLQRLNAMLQSGAIQQAHGQGSLDADFEEFLRAYQDPFDRIAAQVGAVGGVPHGTTQTGMTSSTTQQPDNSGLVALGSLLGAI